MTLEAGTRLGPYDILSPIGAGGMGEVWKARDTRLDRTVAIKVSAAQFSERFEREARAVAALNHPNICTLHDVGPNYLVMEYIQGAPLEGPLPVDQAIRLAIQIAGALDAAHRKGIVHRDLKPANILVNKSGVKLLDFGLAKMKASSILPTDETVTRAITQEGAIVGTLQYMPPEQLEGKEADPRSDIFAFGAVLYEMVTGKRAFEGASPASLIAAILQKDPPPMTALVPLTPPALERVVRKCLAKDPDERWQSARDLKDELEWIAQPSAQALEQTAPPSGKLWKTATAILASMLVLGAIAYFYFRKPAAPLQAFRVSILPPDADTPFSSSSNAGGSAIAPDGHLLAFVAQPKDRDQPVLYVRPLDSLTARALPGTEGAAKPFWSPDSRSIGFFANGKLKRIDLAGGTPQTICEGHNRGATWNSDGVILFCMGSNNARTNLYRVPAAGGSPVAVTALDAAGQEDAHYWPHFLPDGKHFLYMARSAMRSTSTIFVGSLDDKPSQRRRIRLVDSAFRAAYAPSAAGDSGYLLFVRGSTLMAQPFAAGSLTLSGDAAPVADGIGLIASDGYADFSVSHTGLMAYGSGGVDIGTLAWRDRAGKLLSVVGEAGAYLTPELSPDGRLAAVPFGNLQGGQFDIWRMDLLRESGARFTFADGNLSPVWSPDGRQVAYSVSGKGIFLKAASGVGNPRQLTSSQGAQTPTSWSRDGRFLLYHEISAPTGWDIWALPLSEEGSAEPAKPFPYVKTQFNERGGRFSPDGKWVAYFSNESGSDQVYVQGFPEALGKWQISGMGGASQRGAYPRWRVDGKELFFLGAGQKVMAVGVNASAGSFDAGKPAALFPVEASTYLGWGDTRDGQRFLVVQPKAAVAQPMTLLVNWQEALKSGR